MEGRESNRAEAAEALQVLERYCREIEQRRQSMIKESEGQLLDTAVIIARRIIGECAVKEELFKTILENTIKQVKAKRKLHIRVNEEDLLAAEKLLDEKIAPENGIADFTLEKDIAVTRGGCIVETERGNLDGRIESQLQYVRDRISTKGPKEEPDTVSTEKGTDESAVISEDAVDEKREMDADIPEADASEE